MRKLQTVATVALTLAVAFAIGVGAWWLVTHKSEQAPSEKPPPPAVVNKVIKEEDFNTVMLTEEAEKRIGLAVTTVEKKAARRTRVYGGEVAVPIGRTILVVAPLTGILRAAPAGEVKAGQSVKVGQEVFQLTPLLTPDGRATLSASLADADGQVNNAKTQLELGKIALERAKRVLKEGAGSQRQVDEAQASFDVATKTLDAANARYAILKKVVGEAESGTAAPITITAPEAGIVRTVSALSGQTVPSGAALFEVIDLSTAWVRVPMPVGDLDAIDRAEPAQVGKLSAQPGTRQWLAKPVTAPPSANPLSATVDLFYEMPNTEGKFFPGQRLGVSLPLADAPTAYRVPWSAIVFDIHGGTWVYQQVGPRKYTRRRVVVAYTLGPDAVLTDPTPEGAWVVVTAGVQQLFGAETGFVK